MKRIVSLFLAFAMLLSWVPLGINAADTASVTAGAVTVQQGSTVTVSVTAAAFTTVGSVDFNIYYDSTALTLTGTANGGLIDGTNSFLSVNTETAGAVKVSAMDIDGFSASGTLLRLTFRAASGCAAGTYPLTVTVGDAYGADLVAVAVSGVNGSVTVTERTQTAKTFTLSGYVSGSPAQKGDTVTLRVANTYYYNNYSFSSADFTVDFDSSIFELESVELESALKTDKAVYSVNTNFVGSVRISYASSESVTNRYLFTVKLKVIGDVSGTSKLTYSASNVYAEDLSSYLPYSGYTSVTLNKLPEVVDYPDLWLDAETPVAGRQTKATLYLEKGAGVAAGDFVITYDPTVLRCVSVTTAADVAATGGMLVVNEAFTDGTIEFPYVNSEGYSDTDIALVDIVWEALKSPSSHYQAVPSGSMVYDADFAPVTLEYVTESSCIFVPTVTPPACEADGYTTYTCGCGESYQADIVPMLGHDVQTVEAKEPTCTEAGWGAGEKCSRCEFGEYEPLAALGHDLQSHAYKAPTCEEVGWYSYQTCSRCDYTTYQELPAIGHRVTYYNSFTADPLSMCNDSAYPFLENAYTSTNTSDYTVSTFTATAQYDCVVNLSYSVSSEQGCDWLRIYQDGNLLDEISGESSNTMSVSMYYGSVLTISYEKDGSVSSGSDCGWFTLECDQGMDALSLENDGTYPFACGITSTNQEDYSYSEYVIDVLYDCTVEIEYGVSSESGCDEFHVIYNSGLYDAISGENSGYTMTLNLYAGDVLKFGYSKDGSASSGRDCGWFSLRYDEVTVNESYDVSTDQVNPSCTSGVVCSYCKKTVKAALGHNEVSYAGQAPTCTTAGWKDYIRCTRCSYSTYQGLSALGHDLTQYEAKPAGCLEVGWKAYQTCSRCDLNTYVEIPAAGHRIVEKEEWLDPLILKNESTIPFYVSEGVYYSNNHDHSSASEITLTAAYDCVLNLTYGSSSEKNYDKLFILKNETQLDVISGTVSNKTLTVILEQGDVVTVRYRKDGSVSTGSDQGWVQLQYDPVLVPTDIPAETLEATCTDAVVCDYCDTEIKAALGHSYENSLTDCDRCDHVRVITGIAVSTLPGKVEYLQGESLVLDGGVLTLYFDDEASAELPLSAAEVTGFDGTAFGTQTLTVSYGGQTATFAVTVKSPVLPGDVDGDGQVTKLDRAYLARYLAGWEGYDETVVDLSAADLDSDGQITKLDRAILARHLAGWEGYETLPL